MHMCTYLDRKQRAGLVPSKGDIALDVNPARQARIYADSGASVISVLTEPTWFKGSLLDMHLVRQAVDGLGSQRPAILRKEFIFEEYQIAEARLHGEIGRAHV